ncbi:hypothetical protein [Acidovorax sp.]|uniref:hypothetical protein n=1 Tax=Acidovorax sp. TaxID=1872122 RepID=UPI00391CBC9A
MRRKTAFRLLIIPALVFPIVGIFFMLWAWSSFDASDVRGDSIKFSFLAPDYLKSVKIIEKCSEPLFRWKGRDGEGSPFSSIRYGSFASPNQLAKYYTLELKKNGCKVAKLHTISHNDRAIDFICTNNQFHEIQIQFHEKNDCADVAIFFTEKD